MMLRSLPSWLCSLLLTLAIAAPAPAPAQTPPVAAAKPSPSAITTSPRELRDLPYATGGTDHQRLDLYLPADDGKAHPLIIWVHGGGWSLGSKYPYPAAPTLVTMGYAVASVEYRFIQQAIYPAQIQDCKAAVRWLRAHAAEYRLDPAHFGVAGESAGGHLVALLGTTGHTRQFDVGENLDQSSAVQCVIDLYGAHDLLHWGDLSVETATRSDRDDTVLAKLIGGPIFTHQDAARAASPVYFVDKDTAPFLIFHGDKDNLVPVQQSRVLHDALVKAGVESTLKILPGAGHGGPPFARPDNLKLMADFLEKHLRPASAPAASPAAGL